MSTWLDGYVDGYMEDCVCGLPHLGWFGKATVLLNTALTAAVAAAALISTPAVEYVRITRSFSHQLCPHPSHWQNFRPTLDPLHEWTSITSTPNCKRHTGVDRQLKVTAHDSASQPSGKDNLYISFGARGVIFLAREKDNEAHNPRGWPYRNSQVEMHYISADELPEAGIVEEIWR